MLKFSDIVEAINQGGIKEGTVFNGENGEQIVYTDKALRYLTSSGFVSTIVSVTDENVTQGWTVKESSKKSEPKTLLEALPHIANGERVAIVVHYNAVKTAGQEYEVSSLVQLEAVLNKEYLSDLYKHADFYVLSEDKEAGDSGRESVGRKITATEAFQIHVDRKHFHKPVAVIADEYGITTRMVYYILDGTYWADVWLSLIHI